MQNLPVFEAVVEILQSFLLESENCLNQPISIGVDIKAKRRLQKYETGSQVFYVRVCSNNGIDLERGFENNEYRRFGEMLLCMQTGEEDGHLSVQRTGGGESSGTVQRVYWLEQGSGGRTTLTCQHSTQTSNIDPGKSPFIIHFRIIQQEGHIVSEGHRIHKYLHKLKLLKEKIDLSFSMKVCGAVCQTDFSVKKYIAAQNFSMVDDIKHFFGMECTRRMWCGAARAYTRETVRVTQCCGTQCLTSSLGVSVFSVVSLHPLVERYPENHSALGVSGHIVINFFGPSGVALGFPDNHFKSSDASILLNTELFPLKLSDLNMKIHGDMSLGATLTDLRYLPPWASDCTSFLLCVAVIVSDQGSRPDRVRSHEIINCLQDDSKSLSCVLKSAEESITSCLEQIFFRRETEHEKLYRTTYGQCTQMITSSICDIFNHSVDTAFRSEFVHLLQAESKEELKTNLAEKLCEIARISEMASDSHEDEVNVWDKVGINTQQNKTDTLPDARLFPGQNLPRSQVMPPINEATGSTANETEGELLDDIDELNNFDQSIGRDDQSFPEPETHPAPAPPLDHFTEEDLIFFPNELEFLDQHIPVVDDGSSNDDQGGLLPSDRTVHGLANTSISPAPSQRQPIVHSPTGDEWLDDVMFDMSDWL